MARGRAQRINPVSAAACRGPPLDLSVDARAVFDAVSASDACIPVGSSLKIHLVSVPDRIFQGIIRKLLWIGTRNVVVDGLTKGGIYIYIYIYM